MSRLPNAPLLEVVFELRWKISNQKDLEKYQFLTADLYSNLKSKFPDRKLLVPPEVPLELVINKPAYRFSSKESNYPLIQLGPGVLTLNTNDENYYWSQYYDWTEELTNSFFEVSNIDKNQTFTPSLIYIDFIKLNFNEINILNYISENLNINVQQNFIKDDLNPTSFNFGLSNNIKDLGSVHISFNTGKDQNGDSGLVIETKLNGPEFINSTNDILSWLNKAHDYTSKSFKEMTKGKLQDSFSKKQ